MRDIAWIAGLLILGWVLWRGLVRYCERANGADWGNNWINRLDGLNRLFCKKFHRLQHDPLPLPLSGPAIVVANHVSGLDPLIMIAASSRPLRFIIAREEYDRWWLKWLFAAIGCIPVERSTNPRAALFAARRALERGEVVALFPHGRIYLDDQAAPQLKRGVAHLAGVAGAPVFPLRIDGIRGRGHTIAAVFLRSRALVRCFAPLSFQDRTVDDVMHELARILSAPVPLDS
jgi:1-acyl-sn-glycerol-3-phosphate acyltransferase